MDSDTIFDKVQKAIGSDPEHAVIVEKIAAAIERNPRKMRDALQELLDSSRRGVELRERFAPKVGRRFLIQRRGN